MLEFLSDKVTGLQPSNLIKERLQHRHLPVNNAKFLRTPILKSICERLLLLIVIFSQENNHIQRCLDLPEPKLHKTLTCILLVHSPQTTFHRKIVYNFVWIHQGRSGRPEMFCKKGLLRNIAKFTGKHLCQILFFNNVAGLRPQVCNFIKKESLIQVFSCEFCEISKKTFSYRKPLVPAFVWANIA